MANVLAWADLVIRLEAANLAYNGVALPIAYPNTSFARPTQLIPWIRVDMTGSSSSPMELGATNWLDDGSSMIEIFVKTGTGLDASNQVFDDLMAMFRGPPYDPIVYERIVGDPGGGSDDGLYWISSIRADWHVQTVTPRS